MNEFRIEITSVPDRKKLVAEIWHAEKLLAEINQENKNIEIEWYQFDSFICDFDAFIKVLETAKEKLSHG